MTWSHLKRFLFPYALCQQFHHSPPCGHFSELWHFQCGKNPMEAKLQIPMTRTNVTPHQVTVMQHKIPTRNVELFPHVFFLGEGEAPPEISNQMESIIFKPIRTRTAATPYFLRKDECERLLCHEYLPKSKVKYPKIPVRWSVGKDMEKQKQY